MKAGRDHAWEHWPEGPALVEYGIARQWCRRCGLVRVLAYSGPRNGQRIHYFREERLASIGTIATPKTPPCPGGPP